MKTNTPRINNTNFTIRQNCKCFHQKNICSWKHPSSLFWTKSINLKIEAYSTLKTTCVSKYLVSNTRWEKIPVRNFSAQPPQHDQQFLEDVKSGQVSDLECAKKLEYFVSRKMGEECLVLFRVMVVANKQISLQSLMLLLDYFGDIGQASAVQSLISYCKSEINKPTVELYKSMVSATATALPYSVGDLIKEARQLFPKQLNTIQNMCSKVMEKFAERGHLKAIDSLFEVVDDLGMAPTESMLWGTLHAFAKKGDPGFIKYFERLKTSGFEMKQKDLQDLLSDCSRSLAAEAVFSTLTTRTEASYQAMFRVYGVGGNLSKVNELLDSMRQDGIAISVPLYGTLMCIYRDNREYDTVFTLLSDMGNQDLEPNEQVIAAVLSTYGKKGSLEEMMEKFATVKFVGGVPFLAAFRAVLQVLCEQKQEALYLELFREMLTWNIAKVEDFRVVMQSIADAPFPNLEIEQFWTEFVNRNRKPDVFCFNFLLSSLCSHKKWDKVLDYYTTYRMKLQPHYITYKYVLTALCGMKDWDRAAGILQMMKQNGYVITHKTMEPLFDALVEADRQDLIEKYWKLCKEWQLTASLKPYQILMGYYARKNNSVKLKAMIQDMEAQKLVPNAEIVSLLLSSTGVADVVEGFLIRLLKQSTAVTAESTYAAVQGLIQNDMALTKIIDLISKSVEANPARATTTLSLLAKAIDLTDSKQLEALVSFFNQNIKKVKTPSMQDYSIVVGVLLAAKSMKKAEEIFDELRAFYESDPSVEIPAPFYVSIGKQHLATNNKKKLLHWIESWKQANKVPLGHTYGCLMQICVQESQFEKVIEYYKELKSLNVEPDEHCYRCYLTALKELPQWTAQKIMEEVANSRVFDVMTPTIASALVDAFVAKGAHHIAMNMFCNLRDGHMRFDTKTCYNFLCAMVNNGNTEAMEIIMDYMRSLDEKIPTSFFNQLIKYFGLGVKDIVTAEKYYQEMRDRNVLPDLDTFNFMVTRVFDSIDIQIKAYCQNGNHKAAMAILEQKKRRKMKPDSLNYQHLLEAAADTKDPDAAEQYFTDMQQNGVQPTLGIYRAVISSHAKSGNVDTTVKYLEQSKKLNVSWLQTLKSTARLFFERQQNKDEAIPKVNAVSSFK